MYNSIFIRHVTPPYLDAFAQRHDRRLVIDRCDGDRKHLLDQDVAAGVADVEEEEIGDRLAANLSLSHVSVNKTARKVDNSASQRKCKILELQLRNC